MEWLGSLFSAGANLLGGLFGQKNQAQINQANIANQDMLARNRISMTVEDAKRAGINPLAALGNATQTYSNIVGSDSLGSGIGRAGQDIGRAVNAMTAQEDRTEELNRKLIEAKIANVNADTVSKMAVASGTARGLGATGSPPPIPMPRPNPLTTNWDAYYAKPLMENYVGPHGGMIKLPTQEASTATQTLAAAPASAIFATGLAGENLTQGLRELTPGWGEIPGAVWRATQGYYGSPAAY